MYLSRSLSYTRSIVDDPKRKTENYQIEVWKSVLHVAFLNFS